MSRRAILAYTLVAVALSYAFVAIGSLYFNVGPSPSTNTTTDVTYRRILDELDEAPPHGRPLSAYVTFHFAGKTEMIFLVIILSAVTLAFAIVCVVSGRIVYVTRQLGANAITQSTAATQRALTRVIICHSISPVCLGVPVFINVLSAIRGQNLTRIIPTFHALIAFIPSATALFTIMLLPAYRCAFLALLSHSRRVLAHKPQLTTQTAAVTQ